MTPSDNQAPNFDAVYAAVAGRRTQFDGLVWQVPVMGLTAQAFLFTIALAPDTARVPRTVACVLSVIATFLSVQLMTRHRQAEFADAEWLADAESAMGCGCPPAHGREWANRRNKQNPRAGIFRPLKNFGGYITWAVGMTLFAVAATVIGILAWASPASLR